MQTNRPIPDPREVPVLDVPSAGAYLGLGRTAAYEAAHRGDLPTIRIGRRVVVPTAKILGMLGIGDDAA